MWLTRKLAALAHNTNDHSKATSTTAAISAHAVNDDLLEQPATPDIIDPTTKPLPTKPSCQVTALCPMSGRVSLCVTLT